MLIVGSSSINFVSKCLEKGAQKWYRYGFDGIARYRPVAIRHSRHGNIIGASTNCFKNVRANITVVALLACFFLSFFSRFQFLRCTSQRKRSAFPATGDQRKPEIAKCHGENWYWNWVNYWSIGNLCIFLLMACKISCNPCGETMSGSSKVAKKVINHSVYMYWNGMRRTRCGCGCGIYPSKRHALKCKIMEN